MRLAAFVILLSIINGTASLEGQGASVVCADRSFVLEDDRRVRALDATAIERLSELTAASTVVREMLAHLQAAEVSIGIYSNALLLRQRRAGGLSRFFVRQGMLTGRIEFDTGERDQSAQRIALAHELAHAVEIATLPRSSTQVLGNKLLAHIGRHDLWSPNLIIETPFARDVDKRIISELKFGAASAGTLDSLARRHRVKLGDCATDRRYTDPAAVHGARTPWKKN